MIAEKLRNIAKIPGMTELIGTLGIELVNDIADSYSDMHGALTKYRDMYLENTDLNRQGRFFVYVKEILAKASPNHVDTEK